EETPGTHHGSRERLPAGHRERHKTYRTETLPITASRRSGTSFKEIKEGRAGKGVKRDNLCGSEPGSAAEAFSPTSYRGLRPSTGVAALARLLQFGWIKRALSC